MTHDRDFHQRRLDALKNDFNSFRPHFEDLTDFVSPRTSKYYGRGAKKAADLRNSRIYNNTATIALRVLVAGMMSGVTNPARSWLQYRTMDPDLNRFGPVKVWLDIVRKRTLEMLLKSNFYTVMPQVYGDLGLHGTNAFGIDEDAESLIHCSGFPIGSYYLGTSYKGKVDTFYRELKKTVEQLVSEYGKKNCSRSVQDDYDRGNYSREVEIIHAVFPNPDWDDRKLESRFRKFASSTWEVGRDRKLYLKESGYNEFPIIAPRWQTVGEDVYGISPGMDALSDIKMLQDMEKKKLKALAKKVDPPTSAPSHMVDKPINNLPGGVTFYDQTAAGQKIEQTQRIDLNLQELRLEIDATERRINDAFYKDLFLMISNLDRSGITATEIAARQEEKLLALGPVYLRFNDEGLDPVIDRVFPILLRSGQLPPPPPELSDLPLSVEYISVMSQTMKAVGIASQERFITFLGGLAGAFPQVQDKVNADQMVDDYAEMAGVNPATINDADTVKKIRDVRDKQAQAAQAMAVAQQGAEVANKLANAPLSDDNALAQLMQRMKGQVAPA